MGRPQQLRPCVVTFPEAGALRIRKLLYRIGGVRKATIELGIGDSTFEAALGQGRMLASTRDRILVALDRVEATS
ncbi:MAG TPA: hypothetical protein VNJ04_05015 [Gemmatimonadaceae bacterium]|nr:hypothetical protein [Gemmatimonadaceae bacterium]